MGKNYTIGLDIGTASVGWAVIDDEFNLAQGKKRINDNGTKRKTKTNLWGVRLFDEGETAEERRLKRGLRRRYTRRHERLNYLRGIFEPEITKVDESFLIRLDESFYQADDKKALEYKFRDKNGNLITKKVQNKEIYKYPLFKTEKEEKEYYKTYPTIYHLREHLMKSEEKEDIRLVYLAMHHILKYRGHFVNQGQNFDLKNIDIVNSLRETLIMFETAINFAMGFDFDETNLENANEILKDRTKSKSQKAYLLNQLYVIDAEAVYLKGNESLTVAFEEKTEKQQEKFIEGKQKQIKDLFNALVGNKIAFDRIFDNKEYSTKENDDFPKDVYYKNENFDEAITTLEEFLAPEELDVIIQGKKVYESIILAGILTKETLAASMVERYDCHKADLEELKCFSKRISGSLFKKIFSEQYPIKEEKEEKEEEKKDKKEKVVYEVGVYSKYINGSGNPSKRLKREDFYKELKAAISSEIQGLEFPKEGKDFDWEGTNLSREDMEFLERISKSMEFDTYLLKQRISDNGAIPYQVHEYELIKIIEKQGKYYPFLLEKSGEDYIIQSLMKFRIPYFVGPLVQADKGDDGKKYSDKSNFAWLQKKSSDKITPWNFDDVVDRDASGVEFIERMTSYCTYLPDEKVLPKNSLLYQEFCVYNELITSGYYLEGSRQKNYFGEAFTREIVTQLFQKKKKVYQDDVIKFLYNEKHITTTELFGIDKKSVNGKPSFNSSMSTFIDLTKMGIKAETISDNRDLFDEIVKWQTIFTDKKSLQARIKSANQEWQILTDVQAEKLSNKHYKGFGNLSKKLIDGIRDERTNKTIIELLKEAGYDNFMRLVSGATAERYSFKKVIEEAQTKALDKGITYEVVDELAGSPKVKKGIWQSLQIIKELEGFLGRENISRIVIEMSKGPDGGRTKSRYKKTKELYDKFEEKNKDVYDELKQYEKNESALNNEKLYLYFMQNGKDAYTGTKLDIMELPHYEVDHIVPQCFIKDDSVDNKVLVSRKSNQDKGGDVPSSVVVKRMKSIWSLWEKAGLISAKKFKNLTTGSLTDKVKEGFINRQLVENRQITKHVANILVKYFEDAGTVVLTPKASISSQFRKGKIYLTNTEYASNRENVPRYIEKELHKGFPKNRDINDYHHAHDAYINAIVSLYLYRAYPELKKAWVYGEYERNNDEVFGKLVKERKDKSLQLISGMIEDSWHQIDPDTGEIFEIDRDSLLEKVERTLGYRDVNVVKKVERLIGKFGDESVYKKDDTATNFAMGMKKNLNANKYGGTKAPISAFTVIVETKKNKMKAISVPAMYGNKYLNSPDKLSFIQEIFPSECISRIRVEEVGKYTKFENLVNDTFVTRLLSSTEEAHKASSISLSVEEMRGIYSYDTKYVMPVFDKIGEYLRANYVYSEKDITHWQQNVREEVETMTDMDKIQFIKDSFSVTKMGSTTAGGLLVGRISGAKDGRQRHKLAKIDLIRKGTTVIYQSITGLYETRITLD